MIAGTFHSMVFEIVDTTFYCPVNSNALVVGYAAGGGPQWAAASEADNVVPGAIACDAFGSVYINGYYLIGGLNFGPFGFPTVSGSAEYVAKLQPAITSAILEDECAEISMSPNPASGHINVTFPNGSGNYAEIIDFLGRTVLREEGMSTGTSSLFLANLPIGAYLVRLRSGTRSMFEHLVIAR